MAPVTPKWRALPRGNRPHMGQTPSSTCAGMSRRTVLKAGGTLGLAAAMSTFDWSGLTPAEQALAAPGGAEKLDVLFIRAHPDDEASTPGQWHEFHGVEAGVIPSTRGAGGGNGLRR